MCLIFDGTINEFNRTKCFMEICWTTKKITRNRSFKRKKKQQRKHDIAVKSSIDEL